MRTCIICSIEKSESEFYTPKNKIDNRCKDCHREYRKQHYSDNKEAYVKKAKKNSKVYMDAAKAYVFAYLSENPCVDCGEADLRCLQFDHNNVSEKSNNVSSMYRSLGTSLVSLKKEIAKCTVRCANCHAKRTAEQFQYPKYKGIYY